MKKLICDKNTVTFDNITSNDYIVAVKKNITHSFSKDISVGKLIDKNINFVSVVYPTTQAISYNSYEINREISNYDIYVLSNEQEYFRFLAEKLNSLALDFDVEYGPSEEK